MKDYHEQNSKKFNKLYKTDKCFKLVIKTLPTNKTLIPFVCFVSCGLPYTNIDLHEGCLHFKNNSCS